MSASIEERRLSRIATDAPRVPWDHFINDVFQWERGEHVALIGPTGQGKTTLLRSILPYHPFVVVFATKAADESVETLIRDGYTKIDRWQSIDPRVMPRRLLWPDSTRLRSEKAQAEVFADAFDKIYRERAWTIAVDELWWITNKLRLGNDVDTIMLNGRSIHISMVNLTQRPAWIPTSVYDQSTHLFFWRNNDGRAQQRLGEIQSVNASLVRDIVGGLERHQTLYINSRTGRLLRTRCPRIVEGRLPA